MRADRLLSILMLLQARGLMTATELAHELEVSERTIYRDLEALSASGVPVLCERGPGGGCTLPEEYRTNLTGLTGREVRGLFLSAVPGPLADLGLGGAVEAAVLKLAAALPRDHRVDVQKLRERIHVDTAGWFQPEEPVPHLRTIEEAVWQDHRLLLTYRRSDGKRVKRYLAPYGLVAKGGVWYLVAAMGTKMFSYRVSRVQAAELTHERFERPHDFDLVAYWDAWCANFEASLSRYDVTLRFAPDFLPVLPLLYGEGVHTLLSQAAPPDEEGWITLTLTYETPEAALSSVLSFGTGAEILEPVELRDKVARKSLQIVELYSRAERGTISLTA